MTNHPNSYRYPLFVVTDDGYGAVGAISIEGERYVGRDTGGMTLFDRKTCDSAIRAAEEKGFRVVSTSWYDVKPLDSYARAAV